MKSSKNEFLYVRLLKNIYMKSSKRRRPASWCTGGHGARQERSQFCFHSQPSVPPCLPPSSLSLPSSSQPSDSSCLSPSSPPQQTSSVSCCLSSSSPITTFFCFFLLTSYFTTSSLSLPWSFLLDQPPTSSSPPPPINIKSQIFWLCPVWKIFIMYLNSCHIFVKVETCALSSSPSLVVCIINVCRILNAMLIEFNTEGYWNSKNSSSQGRKKVMENWECSYLILMEVIQLLKKKTNYIISEYMEFCATHSKTLA